MGGGAPIECFFVADEGILLVGSGGIELVDVGGQSGFGGLFYFVDGEGIGGLGGCGIGGVWFGGHVE